MLQVIVRSRFRLNVQEITLSLREAVAAGMSGNRKGEKFEWYQVATHFIPPDACNMQTADIIVEVYGPAYRSVQKNLARRNKAIAEALRPTLQKHYRNKQLAVDIRLHPPGGYAAVTI